MSILTWRFQSNWGPDKVQERLSAWPWVRGAESSTVQAARPTSARNKANYPVQQNGIEKWVSAKAKCWIQKAWCLRLLLLWEHPAVPSPKLVLTPAGARLTPSEAWRITSVQWYQLWGKLTQALWYQHPQLQAQKLPQLWSKIRLLEGLGFPSTASQTPSGVGHPAGCKWRLSVTQNNKISLHFAANAQQLWGWYKLHVFEDNRGFILLWESEEIFKLS